MIGELACLHVYAYYRISMSNASLLHFLLIVLVVIVIT